MNYSLIIGLVSRDLNLPLEVVDKTYKSFWKYIRNTILCLPLKEDLDLKLFDKLKTNFNIPSIGKLTCTYDRMIRVKSRFKYIKNLREK